MTECRLRATQLEEKPRSWTGAAVIIAIWLAIAVAAAVWAVRFFKNAA